MPSGAAKVLSRDEVAEAIRSLLPAAWGRLKKTAAVYARNWSLDPHDLLQEAFARALDTRACPEHVDVARFIAEAIRSIAFDTAERVENKVVFIPVAKTGGGEAEELVIPDPAPSAEAQLIEAEEAANLRNAIFGMFEDDPVARDIVEGTIEGMDTDELRELTGLEKTDYASKRRLIRRRIDKAFPEGWKP